MLSDFRYALRSLLRTPGYTIVALATLALGIGANTSMFSVVDTLLFRSAPYPESDRLVQLSYQTRSGGDRFFSDLEIREIRPQADTLSSLTAVGFLNSALAEPGRPAERINGMALSADMADTFRVGPAIGRPFAPAEFEPGKNQVILLSDACWRNRFGADPTVVGRTLRLDGEAVTIIGVMPASFDYRLLWGNVAFWRPLNFTHDQSTYRGYRSFQLIGRMKPGVTPAAVANQLATLAPTQEKNFPQDYPGLRYQVKLLHDSVMDEIGRALSWMLLGLSGFVLLIGCANLANLQLARATSALREFAIRTALGASRSRLIRQQLTECVVLAVAGGALGCLIAASVNQLLERNILIDGVPGFHFPIDPGVLAITLLVSLATGVLFGLVPAAIASRTDVNTALKQQSRGSTTGRGHHRIRQVLIVGEVALALVLLGGAAVMNRGFGKMLQREAGWDFRHVLVGSVSMPEARFDSGEKRIDFFRRLETRLAALPGVEHAALSSSLPLFDYNSNQQVFRDAPAADGATTNPAASNVMVTPDYFATLGIRLIEGRTFPADIKAGGPRSALINESLAKLWFPHGGAVGQRFGRLEGKEIQWNEIIGVVADVEPAASLTNAATRFTVYRALVQEPWASVQISLRSRNPAALVESVRRAVSEVDADIPADGVSSVVQFADRQQHNLVVVGYLLSGFAFLGLVLAAVGLYGVISNLVAQRTTEFGIRLALGAEPRDVLKDVLRRGLNLTGLGLALGLIGAFGLARFLASIMPRLAASDPAGLVGVALLLLAVSLIACWVPARRATKVDPLTALRAE